MKKVLAILLVLTLFSGSLKFPVKKVTGMVITDLDNDSVDDYVFACEKIVSDPWSRGVIYVYEDNQLKWYYHLATAIKGLAVHDLDSDGKKEIITACDVRIDKGGDLYVFDSNGRLKWHRWFPGTPKSVYCYQNFVAVNLYGQGERIMIFNYKGEQVKDLPVNGDISKFEIVDTNNDGVYELVVSGIANDKWEHFLTVYDMEEDDPVRKVLWNYETPEHINDFKFHDIDGDGTMETILGVYDALYVTRGGDLLGKIELPPSLLHVEVIQNQILIVNQNTMFLVQFSDILNLNGSTVPMTEFTGTVNAALRLSVKPQFLFLKDVDSDEEKEILVGDGEILEVHELEEFAPPELVVTVPAALITKGEVTYILYENKDYGMRIKYPADWILEEKETEVFGFAGNAVVFSSLRTSASFSVTVCDMSARPVTLEEVTASALDYYEQEEYEISEEGGTTLAGNPAHEAVVTKKVGLYTVKMMQIWTIRNDLLYIITYDGEVSHYSFFSEVAEEMINSFTLLERVPLVSICEVQFDAPGEDRDNLNGEWVKICNNGTADIDMTGWSLENKVGAFYEFPDGFILRAGSFVIVYTGTGENTETAVYWKYPVEAWNNYGDTATLVDGEGNIVDEYTWTPG